MLLAAGNRGISIVDSSINAINLRINTPISSCIRSSLSLGGEERMRADMLEFVNMEMKWGQGSNLRREVGTLRVAHMNDVLGTISLDRAL
jgi:hypothetical protein